MELSWETLSPEFYNFRKLFFIILKKKHVRNKQLVKVRNVWKNITNDLLIKTLQLFEVLWGHLETAFSGRFQNWSEQRWAFCQIGWVFLSHTCVRLNHAKEYGKIMGLRICCSMCFDQCAHFLPTIENVTDLFIHREREAVKVKLLIKASRIYDQKTKRCNLGFYQH